MSGSMTSGTQCDVDGCDLPTKARGLCNGHYRRLRRYGAADFKRQRQPLVTCAVCGRTVLDPYAARHHRSHDRAAFANRFWPRVDRRGPDECWEWQGARTSKGYGSLKSEYAHLASHRVAYELLVGPIPEGLTIDHLCRNPPCVNPAHLEPVTNLENIMRKPVVTQCPAGHPYDEANTHTNGSGRRCRACQREAWHRRKLASDALRGVPPATPREEGAL